MVIKKKKKTVKNTKEPDADIEQYTHDNKKRSYNPPVGLVTPQTDKDLPKKKYSYDPHLDPQLIWSGKKENTSFEVDTVSLHVHERIDPITIIENVMKKQKFQQETLFHYFELPENNLPNRLAIEFYKHDQNWSNRLIAGDSLLVMNSLLQKENMAGKVQTIYIDPPYGIKYGSNFQPFINKRDVKDGKDEDLTQEPEMIQAFRDTWELGIHSYLTYLRDRLLLSKELMTESGSCFIQISDENVHRVRMLMDEIFGANNFVSLITVKKTTGLTQKTLDNVSDYIIWYAKNIEVIKFHQLYFPKGIGGGIIPSAYNKIELADGTRRYATLEEKNGIIPKGSKLYSLDNLTSQSGGESSRFPIEFEGKEYRIEKRYWSTNLDGIKNLIAHKRIEATTNRLGYVRYLEDFPGMLMTNVWTDVVSSFLDEKVYAVQTKSKIIQRCILMTTDPGDLIFDPTCGSGTSAFVAEGWGRRWITCDTSRVAITLTKQRLATSIFDYYELNYPQEGVSSGFKYQTIPCK